MLCLKIISLFRDMTMKKHHIILLVILIITLGNLLFLYPKQSSLSIPVEWGPGIDWGRYHIVNEGRIYEGGDYGLTWQSNLKNYGSVDVLPKIHYAILNIITGTVNFPNDLDLHYRFLWSEHYYYQLLYYFGISICAKREYERKQLL